MRTLVFGLLCLAVSCAAVDNWEVRQAAEFDWDATPYHTERHYIPVVMPCWLDGEDYNPVLEAVDKYWDLMLQHFETAKLINPSEYTIHIHDNPGAFWAGNGSRGVWAHGWCIGHHIVVAWSWEYDMQLRPCDLAEHNPLDPLCHEWLHVLFDYERFWEDVGHAFYDGTVELILSDIAAAAPTVKLNEKSIQAAREYRYILWGIGGGPAD